jgi:transcriptional regulator with XRE-family HTH domain
MSQGQADNTRFVPKLHTLQEKLSYLLAHVTDAQGKLYTHASLAAAVRTFCPELTTTRQTITNVVNGTTHDPSWRLMEGLAKAFAIKTDFFRDETPEDEVQATLQSLEALELFKRGDIRALAARAQNYDPEVVAAITDLMTVIAEREQRKRNPEGPGEA